MVDNSISPYARRLNQFIADATDATTLTEQLFREYQHCHDADKLLFVAAMIQQITSEVALRQLQARRGIPEQV